MKIMKRLSSFLMALLILGCLSSGLAPAFADERELTVLTIGTVTPLEGNLYGKMWGMNTTDVDLRLLLHGASTVSNRRNYEYQLNSTILEDSRTVEESNGSLTYEFTLHDDLQWSDGTKITAADYVFTVLLQSSHLIAELGGDNNHYALLTGFEDYATGKSEFFAGVHLINETTFSLNIAPHSLPFFYELTAVDVTPTPLAVLAPNCEIREDNDGRGAYIEGSFTHELLEETLLGEHGYEREPSVVSGPYTLVSVDREKHEAEFRLNPYYGDWAGKKPTIDVIRVVPVTAENMAEKLENGDVDVIHKISSLDAILSVQKLAQDGKGRIVRYARAGYGYVTFNCEQATVASESVRKAIAYSLDKDSIVENFGGGYAERVFGMYGKGQWMSTYRVVREDTEEEGESIADDDEMLNLASLADFKSIFGAAEDDEESEDVFNAAKELEKLPQYTFDLAKAEALLVEDGWTLDTEGKPWTEGKIRAKMIDGTLTPLVIRFGQTIGSVPAAEVAEQLAVNLPIIGAKLEVTEVEFNDMLRMVYQQTDRSNYDMFVMASNFDYLFDPFYMFNTDEAYDGTLNTTALHDPELMALALEMRQTIPGHDELYARRWLAFQRAWADTLPTIPLYTNDNVDYIAANLYGWTASSTNSWAHGIADVYFR